MTASIWSDDNDITLNCWRITHFSFLWTEAIFDLICFCSASSLNFLLLLNFLFTRGYFTSARVEIFQIIEIFFNSVYRVENSTRLENLHIIGSLVNANKNVTELLLILILAEKRFSLQLMFGGREREREREKESSRVYRKALPCFRLDFHISEKVGDISLRKRTHFLSSKT